MNKLLVLSFALLGFTGCASVQLPPDQVEHFEASLRGAKDIGALGMPAADGHRGAFGMSAAKEHLELASDQADVAKTMAAHGDPRAVLLLARAQSEADLALGIARQGAMHRRALEATEATDATDDPKTAPAHATR
jgi:hypothetical protein